MNLSQSELREISKFVVDQIAKEETFKQLNKKCEENVKFFIDSFAGEKKVDREIREILKPVVEKILDKPDFVTNIRAEVSIKIDKIVLEIKEQFKEVLSNIFD